MKKLISLIASIGLISCSSGGSGSSENIVNIYTTNESAQFLSQTSQVFTNNPVIPNLLIDDSVQYQQIEGFGAAITDSSAYLLYSLPEPTRSEVLQQLFGTQGIAISMIRVPISASDFSLYNYTYDDMPLGESDPALTSFSIFHDMTYIIPLLKMIKNINPSVKMIATPWSAPAWMKTNQNYFGSYNNGSYNNITGELLPQYMPTYANFLVKALQDYQSNGLIFDYLTVQNEPLFAPDSYGGMYMAANQQSTFLNDYVAPAFADNNLTTQILTYDHNWDHPEYPAYVLSRLNNVANNIVTGSAYHCYGGDVTVQSQTHKEFPNKKIFMTECSGGNWAPVFSDNLVWDMQNLFIGNLNNWGNAGIKWNMALDQNNGPYVGGCTDCRGLLTINTVNNQISYNEDFYAVGNMSKFIKPDAYRISASSSNPNIEATAVKNPSGQLVVILVNGAESEQKVILGWHNQSITTNVAGKTVAVVIWN